MRYAMIDRVPRGARLAITPSLECASGTALERDVADSPTEKSSPLF